MNNIKVTVGSVLNMLLIFCILRFGLTFTVGFGLFELTHVVVVGAAIVILNIGLSRYYAGKLLQLNAAYLLLNICLVAMISMTTKKADYAATAANYINQLIILFFLWGFYLYMRDLEQKTRRKIVLVYLFVVLISAAYTFYVELNGHERIIRNTASGEYDPSFPLVYGGYDFIYGLVLVYAIMLTAYVHMKERLLLRSKLFLIAAMILVALTVIASGYTTAFALIMICSLLTISRRWTTKMIWLGIVFLGFFVFPKQLASLVQSFPYIPKITSTRITDLILVFTGQASVEYVAGEGQRFDRMGWSIDAFFANPLFGAVGSNAPEKLGGHTEWIDQAARYGIFPMICNTAFWISTYKKMRHDTEEMSATNRCVRNAFVMYLILGFLNPISMVVTTAPLFILCPFVEDIVDTKDK